MDDRISKVLDYIEGHLSLTLELKDLAKVACMSQGHFHQVFKKETGRTPFKFIEEIKMNKAHQMLISMALILAQLMSFLARQTVSTLYRNSPHLMEIMVIAWME